MHASSSLFSANIVYTKSELNPMPPNAKKPPSIFTLNYANTSSNCTKRLPSKPFLHLRVLRALPNLFFHKWDPHRHKSSILSTRLQDSGHYSLNNFCPPYIEIKHNSLNLPFIYRLLYTKHALFQQTSVFNLDPTGRSQKKVALQNPLSS